MTASVQTGSSALGSVSTLASTRSLRLGIGISLAIAVALIFNWSVAFITAVLTGMLLALPQPPPSIKLALGFLLVIGGTLLLGLTLLPMLHNQPAAAVLVISLAVFGCFYFGANGGSQTLVTFLLIGITLIPVIGSESVDVAIGITSGMLVSTVIAFPLVWLSFALVPDREALPRMSKAKVVPPERQVVIRSALRSTAIMLPAFYWLLLTSETAAYVAVLLKIATMGQQCSLESARAAGRELMWSTFIGGIAAILIWNVLQIWPTVLIYSLLFLLCGLIMGPRIFSGAGLAPRASFWSYGLVTMMIVLAPAAMDTASGTGASARFSERIIMFALATIYAVAAIYLFEALWPAKQEQSSS
jgi:hypothetical protein